MTDSIRNPYPQKPLFPQGQYPQGQPQDPQALYGAVDLTPAGVFTASAALASNVNNDPYWQVPGSIRPPHGYPWTNSGPVEGTMIATTGSSRDWSLEPSSNPYSTPARPPISVAQIVREAQTRLADQAEISEGAEPTLTGKSALDIQIGGGHYKDFKIQPVEFIHANNIGFLPGNVIKYVCRYAAKDGIKDLEKARHYIDMLIELERAKDNNKSVSNGR